VQIQRGLPEGAGRREHIVFSFGRNRSQVNRVVIGGQTRITEGHWSWTKGSEAIRLSSSVVDPGGVSQREKRQRVRAGGNYG